MGQDRGNYFSGGAAGADLLLQYHHERIPPGGCDAAGDAGHDQRKNPCLGHHHRQRNLQRQARAVEKDRERQVQGRAGGQCRRRAVRPGGAGVGRAESGEDRPRGEGAGLPEEPDHRLERFGAGGPRRAEAAR